MAGSSDRRARGRAAGRGAQRRDGLRDRSTPIRWRRGPGPPVIGDGAWSAPADNPGHDELPAGVGDQEVFPVVEGLQGHRVRLRRLVHRQVDGQLHRSGAGEVVDDLSIRSPTRAAIEVVPRILMSSPWVGAERSERRASAAARSIAARAGAESLAIDLDLPWPFGGPGDRGWSPARATALPGRSIGANDTWIGAAMSKRIGQLVGGVAGCPAGRPPESDPLPGPRAAAPESATGPRPVGGGSLSDLTPCRDAAGEATAGAEEVGFAGTSSSLRRSSLHCRPRRRGDVASLKARGSASAPPAMGLPPALATASRICSSTADAVAGRRWRFGSSWADITASMNRRRMSGGG